MFRKSKIKIITLIMATLVVLLLGIMALIYFVSYTKINNQNREMLQKYADEYAINGNPTGNIPEGNPSLEDHLFDLSTFYSVSFSQNNEVLEINNDSNLLFTDDEMIEFAAELLEKNKNYGTRKNIAYLITYEESYTLVTMMDKIIIDNSLATLLRYTIIFGCISVFIFLIISLFLAAWIIRPLEEAYQKQKQFISDAGHELKTPISTISTNAELLSREISENKWLANIQYENKRMSYIVLQLLDLAKVENLQIVPEKINLDRIVLAATLPFEASAYEKGIEISYSLQDNLQIYGNPRQIGELISILLDNALQHSSENGNIRISLTTSHGAIILAVANRGKDIPLEQREQIFERFYRADPARNSENNRYGLGLAIAKAIVVAHHGNISVSCKDGYTTFTVTIPQKRGGLVHQFRAG